MKTLTFAIMHFSIAFLVAYALTGSWAVGGAIAIVEPLVNTVGYTFHEKIWIKIKQNRASQPMVAGA